MSEKMTGLLKQWGQTKQQKEVPEFFSNGIDQILKELPAKKIRASFKKKILISLGSTAAATTLLIGSGFISPTIAAVLSEVPILSSFFEKSADPILVEMNDKGLVSPVQRSATSEGITLTFTDLFFDGTKLALAYQLEMPDNLPMHEAIEKGRGFPFEFQAKINNQELSYMSEAEEKPEGDGTYSGMISMDVFTESKLEEPLFLNLNVNKIHEQSGEWQFNIPLENKQVVDSSSKFAPMTSLEWQDVKAVVEGVDFTPASSAVDIKVTAPKDIINDVEFMIYDEHKTLLGGISGFGGRLEDIGDGKAVLTKHITLPKLDRIPEKLNIEMFKIRHMTENEPGSKELNMKITEESFPISIPINAENQIIITGIKYEEERTLLNYEVKGDAILQNHIFQLITETGNVEIPNLTPIRVSEDSMSFALEYKAIDPNSNLQLKTYIDEEWTRESKFFEVDLEK